MAREPIPASITHPKPMTAMERIECLERMVDDLIRDISQLEIRLADHVREGHSPSAVDAWRRLIKAVPH